MFVEFINVKWTTGENTDVKQIDPVDPYHLKTVFGGSTQVRRSCSGVYDLQDGAEVFSPHDARPEASFIFCWASSQE